MDYDHHVAEQNVAVYGDEQQYQHHGGDEYEEDNQREDYYSERGGGVGGGGPMDNVDDSTVGGQDLKNSVDDSSAGKLFVGGIAWETTEESFSRYFGKYGEIIDSVIMMDKISGRPRGFGFVTFADPEVANKVLEEEHMIDGRIVEVKKTVPREDMQGRGVSKTKKIFVGGIPLSLTEDELREYFSSYGNVVEHQIMLDHKTMRSRGFGFVTFENEDAVEKIFADGQMHELGGKQVEIKRAEPKRSGNDHASDNRLRRGGNNLKSYGGYGGVVDGFSGGYGKVGRGYGGGGGGGGGGYGGYGGGYGGYGNYGGNYGGGAGFYAGYGGYGYGFGFGGGMYGGAAGYGPSSYGTPGGYGAAAGYGVGGRGYGSVYDGAKSYGGAAAGYGGGSSSSSSSKGHGTGSGGGGYGGKGYGNGSATTGRFHPYRK